MTTRHTPADHARATDPQVRRLAGQIRRAIVDRTTKAIWKLIGYTITPGVVENILAEAFGALGLFARPPEGVEAAAVVAQVGGADHPIVVASRDERTWKAVASAIGADETMLYNSVAVVFLKADGSIEARSAGGTALPLATKADLEALRDAIVAWTPVGGDGGAALKVALTDLFTGPPAWPAGTTKLKAE